MEKRKIRVTSHAVKTTEYPIIYSYIYERETEDIKRLSAKFKNARVKKATTASSHKNITGYKMVDGKVVPIFEEKETVKKSTKKTVPKKNNSTLK